MPDDLGQKEKPMDVSQGETVLVVEDESSILMLITTLLDRLGYKVLSAETPEGALEKARQLGDSLDLLIADVVMPDMTGKELSEKIQPLCTKAKTLFISGYTANVITKKGVLDQGVNFLQKPFSLTQLARKVREVFDTT